MAKFEISGKIRLFVAVAKWKKDNGQKWADQYITTYNFPKVGYCNPKPGFFEKNDPSRFDGDVDGAKHQNNQTEKGFRYGSNLQMKKSYRRSSKAMR